MLNHLQFLICLDFFSSPILPVQLAGRTADEALFFSISFSSDFRFLYWRHTALARHFGCQGNLYFLVHQNMETSRFEIRFLAKNKN